jgi:hypothetical protein
MKQSAAEAGAPFSFADANRAHRLRDLSTVEGQALRSNQSTSMATLSIRHTSGGIPGLGAMASKTKRTWSLVPA